MHRRAVLRVLYVSAHAFRYQVSVTWRRWIDKPDPAGFGRTTYDTNDLDDSFMRLIQRDGHRVDSITDRKAPIPTDAG